MSLKGFLEGIERNEKLSLSLVHHERIPKRRAEYAEVEPPLPPHLEDALAQQKISQLYSHQSEALDIARSGKNIVAVTPTASGKSLIYNLPVLESMIKDRDARALYMFPLKALE